VILSVLVVIFITAKGPGTITGSRATIPGHWAMVAVTRRFTSSPLKMHHNRHSRAH